MMPLLFLLLLLLLLLLLSHDLIATKQSVVTRQAPELYSGRLPQGGNT